jgi:hypothetical protein
MSQPAARRAFVMHDKLRQEIAATDGDYAGFDTWRFIAAVHDLLSLTDRMLAGDADKLGDAARAVLRRLDALRD